MTLHQLKNIKKSQGFKAGADYLKGVKETNEYGIMTAATNEDFCLNKLIEQGELYETLKDDLLDSKILVVYYMDIKEFWIKYELEEVENA